MADAADRYASLGIQCERAGRSDEAAALFRLGLVHRPEDGGLLHLLGRHRLNHRPGPGSALPAAPMGAGPMGAGPEGGCAGLGLLRRANRLDPTDADLMRTLGTALERAGRGGEAVAVHRRAVALRPDDADILYTLANTLHGLDRLEEAGDGYRAVRHLAPGLVKAHINLGLVLAAQARPLEAAAAFDTAIAHAPPGTAAQARAHWNLSLALLLAGRLTEGWEEYEWRWREPTFPSPARGFSQPLWTGDALGGRTILLHAEQGLGDALHFVRYAPLVAARGGRVVLEVQQPLARLMTTVPGVAQVVTAGAPLPPFDVHCPLLSLPRAFATTLATIPATIPYLAAEPDLAARWNARLGPHRGLRVGLVWAGNPRFEDDRARSPGLAALRPLLDVAGIRVFALQKGEGRRDLEDWRGRLPPSFVDLGDDIADFADTAAIMANLDLVISSCTAPPLLAGALGRPTWLALKRVPDWRWQLDREDTPWYPTMRLFRQTRRGDWGDVVARMADDLSRFPERRPRTGGPGAPS